MRFKFVVAALALSLSCGVVAGAEAPPTVDDDPAKPKVMILGTYHFTGGGSDYVAGQVDDHLAPGRQAEIAEVVERLAAFAPTKIVVELKMEHEADFNADYAAYLNDERALSVNEREQIGARLAAKLGHSRLYGVDYASNMDFEAMMAAAAAAGQTGLIARVETTLQEIAAHDAALAGSEVSVLSRLQEHNAPEFLSRHNIYLTLAQMGAPNAPVGAQQMEAWWGRNLKIFAAIAQTAEPGDRVLVIYGSGHKFLLDQFVRDADELEWVDVATYLQDAP